MSDGLNNLLFMEEALVTQNLPFSGIYSSHGSALIPSNNSSNVSALNFPTRYGNTSMYAAKRLTRQGYQIYTLIGGLNALNG